MSSSTYASLTISPVWNDGAGKRLGGGGLSGTAAKFGALIGGPTEYTKHNRKTTNCKKQQ